MSSCDWIEVRCAAEVVWKIHVLALGASVSHTEGGNLYSERKGSLLWGYTAMMWGSLAWNWRTDMLRFHLLFFFYLSALQCLIMSWLSRSNKSPGCRVIIFLCRMAPLPPPSHHYTGTPRLTEYFRGTWQLVRVRLEGWMPVIEGYRPGYDMQHKYVQEKGW